MLQKSDIEKLERFSKRLSDADEERYINRLFSEGEENLALKGHIHTQWNDYLNTSHESFELSALLDKVHHRIHISENRKKQTLTRKIYRWYSLAAAILLIPLLIGSIFWNTGKDTNPQPLTEERVTSNLIAPAGSRIAFTLPDGTKGWLNSGSSLAYSLPFGNQRQVSLVGEAWFDVAHDEKNPFEIKAGKSNIKVLGTKFNLNAYPAESYIEVVLEEGKVEFTCPGITAPIIMKPDERLVYRSDGIDLDMTDASKFAAWVDGKLVFRGDPMAEVARRLERWYNIDVEIMDKNLESYSFRGTFQDDSLSEVLRLLSMTSPIRYKISERKALSDGTYEKTKVLLYQKNIKN